MCGSAEYEQGRRECASLIFLRHVWIAALVIAAFLLIASKSSALAQAPGVAAEIEFDIPSQSLASSLKVYSAITNLELYYESSLVDGRRSPSIRGSFSPDVALRRLLEGTGFSIASLERGTVTILPSRQPPKVQDLAVLKSKAAEFTPYFALIQERLHAAFCQVPAIQVDTDELIIRLWIEPSSGAVSRAEILSPTGSKERDRLYATVMRTLVIGQAPPQAMPQPVTLMVLPRTSRAAAGCSRFGGSSPVRASAYE